MDIELAVDIITWTIVVAVILFVLLAVIAMTIPTIDFQITIARDFWSGNRWWKD